MTREKQVRVVFLWHMHQPSYRSPLTGEYLMPWALVHGMRDYYDMAELASRDSRVKVAINLVPGMLMQLEEYATGSVNDLWLGAARKTPALLSRDEKQFLLSNFFNVHPDTMIHPYPRYAELFDRAGVSRGAKADKVQFSDADWGDLQVFFFLSWAGLALRRDARVAALLAKGRNFTQADKDVLQAAVVDLLQKVVPLYRRLHQEGRVEVSCSPMYHPILPLLVDSISAREALPDIRLPASPYLYPEDAKRQVERGLALGSRLMRKPVVGMWPSEGAISEPVMALLDEAGVQWIAADEKVLAASSGLHAGNRPDLLYRPWRWGRTAVLFRDAVLSDLIGFVYSRWAPELAVSDFLEKLHKAGSASALEAPVITIAMDGENAWEHYVHGGMRFVELLYERMAQDGRFRMMTPSEVVAELPCEPLERVSAGSWIDGTFRTWIGDSAKNRGWEHLLAARQAAAAFLAKNHLEEEHKQQLLDTLHRAEASDWFWWLGEGHSSPYDAQFDLLFRHHLKAIYQLVDREPPAALENPLDEANVKHVPVQMPVHWVSPPITGREDSYYKWLSAGRVKYAQGFSHRPNYLIRELRFGFDRANLYFKVEASGSMLELMRNKGLEVELHVVRPEVDGVRVLLDEDGAIHARCARREVVSDAEVAVVHSLELRVPMTSLCPGTGVAAGVWVECYVLVKQDGREIERFPTSDNVSFEVRGEELDAENWHV